MTLPNHNVSFGALLQTLRRRQRLTQQGLAKALGVHRRTLIRWEQGEVLPDSKAMVLELARCLKLDDQETRQLLEASLTAFTPHWFVPYPRNPFFTGREQILEALHTQLKIEQVVALTQSSALHGLGGVGKTQIALEYAYRHALEYSAVFWIEAEKDEQVVASLLRIAETLQLPEQNEKDQQRVIAAVQRWLSTHGQWLLIWDNVEDLMILRRFLPNARSGAILLTTRCQASGTLARSLGLLPMKQEEGLLFLLRRAKVLSPEATREQVHQLAPPQYTAASELVTVLGGLPLALDQAGAYLEETQCELPAYLDLFRTRRDALLKLRGEGIHDHPASVSTTFILAITAASERHPAVKALLQICALLQPDAIPEEIFRQGGEHLGPTLEAICRDPLEWDRVVGISCAYSLLSRQPEEQTISIHRLVQAVLLDEMTIMTQEGWNRRVIEALDEVLPEVRDAGGDMAGDILRERCNRILPHVLYCLRQTESTERSLVSASLAYKTAFVLYGRARYAEAKALQLRVLQIREQILGPNHPEVASSLHYLATFNWVQGKYAEAEVLYLRTLQIREQILGPHHLEVAGSLNNLAILYLDQGRYTETEALYLRVLQIREEALGSDHPKIGQTLNNLALLYRDQERYAEAEPLYQRALHIWEQQLGPDHPEVAHPLNGLANLYRKQCKYTEAEAFYSRALTIREQQLGQHHPMTAETLYDLALLRQEQGNSGEALSLAERVLQIRSQALGDAHPKTLAARTLSAQLVQEQA